MLNTQKKDIVYDPNSPASNASLTEGAGMQDYGDGGNNNMPLPEPVLDDGTTQETDVNGGGDNGQMTLTDDQWRSLLQAYSVSQEPPKNTTLPPEYYYPGINQNVIRGQMSTPLGTNALISPGLPAFPYSVLDAIEREKVEAKNKWVEESLKPLDIDYLHVDHNGVNDNFGNAQIEYYEGLETEYLEKANGDWVLAKKMINKDGVLKKAKHRFETIQKVINEGATKVNEVIANKDSKNVYTSPEVFQAAVEFKNIVDLNDFSDEGMDKMYNAYNKIQMVEGMEVALQSVVTAMSASVFEDEILREVFTQGLTFDKETGELTPESLKKFQTTKDRTAQRLHTEGLDAFMEEEINERLEAAWNKAYAKYDGLGSPIVPSKEEFFATGRAMVTKHIEWELEKVTEYDLGKEYRSRDANTLNIDPVKKEKTIGGKNRLVIESGLTKSGATRLAGFDGDLTTTDGRIISTKGGAAKEMNIISKNEVLDANGNVEFVYYLISYEDQNGNMSQGYAESNTSLDGAWEQAVFDSYVRFTGNEKDMTKKFDPSTNTTYLQQGDGEEGGEGGYGFRRTSRGESQSIDENRQYKQN